ncbi:hypothetical protein [Hymenobacter rigui]|uniref:Uncharacterized protein n=1 Tax=Hymenobacter rigui TaxID=334424 RepID=A0A428KUD2_9BACT|nr:hypothetical protein [Hymenobacter rigui]RSK50114.1 hypothetical protein EI291_05535 [Hymenobacter rigui]
MKFGYKQAAREARAARKAIGKQYNAVRAILLEGTLELTVRSGARTVALSPQLKEVSIFLSDVADELMRQYLALKQEEQEHLEEHAYYKELDKQSLKRGQEVELAERRNNAC